MSSSAVRGCTRWSRAATSRRSRVRETATVSLPCSKEGPLPPCSHRSSHAAARQQRSSSTAAAQQQRSSSAAAAQQQPPPRAVTSQPVLALGCASHSGGVLKLRRCLVSPLAPTLARPSAPPSTHPTPIITFCGFLHQVTRAAPHSYSDALPH